MNTKPSAMWHMMFWLFIFTATITIFLSGALVFTQIPIEDMTSDILITGFYLGSILMAGIVMGAYFAVVMGVPLGIFTELILEDKERRIAAETIHKQRYAIYGLAFGLVLILTLLLTALPPIDTFQFIFLSPQIVSVILAVLMVAASHYYLRRLLRWTNALKEETADDTMPEEGKSTQIAATSSKKSRKGDLPPLVLKTDETKQGAQQQ